MVSLRRLVESSANLTLRAFGSISTLVNVRLTDLLWRISTDDYCKNKGRQRNAPSLPILGSPFKAE